MYNYINPVHVAEPASEPDLKQQVTVNQPQDDTGRSWCYWKQRSIPGGAQKDALTYSPQKQAIRGD